MCGNNDIKKSISDTLQGIKELRPSEIKLNPQDNYYSSDNMLIPYSKEILLDEDKFRKLAETSEAGMFIVKGTKCIYANHKILSVTGYSAEEFYNSDCWFIIHPEYKQLVKDRLAARLRGGGNT